MHLQLRRSFGWGVLLISDARSRDIPVSLPKGPVTATDTAVAIAVRHAQDVDYEGGETAPAAVSVNVLAGPADVAATDFEGSIRLGSGVLAVGDAEQEETVDVRPGSYRVQVRLDHPEYAENVDVWLTPADV
jgi:hypothetical protein